MPHQPNSSVSSEGAPAELSKSKTIIRALTKKFNNRNAGTQDAAASAAARQRRQQAALRQVGLLPALSLSQQEAQLDNCIPICDPCQSDLESEADRIKREWEAKNAGKEKELPEPKVDVDAPDEPEIDDYIVRLIRTDSSSSATPSPTVIAPSPRPSSPSPLATSVASSLPSLYSDSSRANASSPEPVTPQSTGPALDDRENGILDVVIEEPEPLSSRTSFNLKPSLTQSHSRSRSPTRPPSSATAVPLLADATGAVSAVADRLPSPVSAVDPPKAADRPLSPVSVVDSPKSSARSPSPIAVVDPPKAAARPPSPVAALPPPVASARSKMSDSTHTDESWDEIPPVPPPKDDQVARSKTSVAPRKPQKPAVSAGTPNPDKTFKKGVFNRFTRSNTTAGTSGKNGATTSQPPPIPQRRGLSSSPQKRTLRILRTVVGSFPAPSIQRDDKENEKDANEKKKVQKLEADEDEDKEMDKEEEKQKPSEEEKETPSSPGSFFTAPSSSLRSAPTSSESDVGPSRGRVMPLLKRTAPVSPTSETMRQAVDPTIHNAGTILYKVNNIEDPETRRMTEHAFM